MNSLEFGRRIAHLRADAVARAKLALLWQGERPDAGATGADCAKRAREPTRRLEILRRRTEPLPPFPPRLAYRTSRLP